jgi:hypothetical protein
MAQSRVSGLDETTNKYPTITIAIIGHGEDLINKPISEDPNIRIFSRAGQPFCIGIAGEQMLDFVENLYYSPERTENMNEKSSYQMLRKIADHYNNSENDGQFKGLCDRLLIENSNDSQIKHTKKIIECKKHNQIYTPFYDHIFYFTDNRPPFAGQNGIHILETINHVSKNNIDFKNDNDNLALKNLFIKKTIEHRKKFFEERIIEFLEKFNLGPDLESNLLPDDKERLEELRYSYPEQQILLNKTYKDELDKRTNWLLTGSKIQRYSKAILEKFPFINPLKLIREFYDESSEIHKIFNEDDDTIIKAKAKELDVRTKYAMIQEKKKAIEEKDEERGKQIEQKIQELREQKEEFLKSDFDGMITGITLSELIDFLKSEGFVVINIIDFTCRTVSKYLDDAYSETELEEQKTKKDIKQERIREYEEEQAMGSEGIRKDKGGRKKRRTRKTKSKKNKKTKRNKNKVK